MKQSQKLNALISKIIKEELDSRSKGVLDMEVSEDLLRALINPSHTDSPINLKDLNLDKGTNGVYRIMIQSKTPEFRQFKKDFKQVKNYIPGDLEDEYDDVAKAIEKVDIEGSVDLIKQGRKAGMEEDKEYVTQDGTANTATGPQKKSIGKAKAGETITYRKAGSATTSTTQGALEENEEEMQEPQDMEQMPKASELAGQVAEIMEKLKSMAEGEDPKKGKHAAKVMKYMESAKAALEALTAHETMLEEKEQAAKEDDATKQLKGVRKQIDKILKDKEMADRVMEKMSVQKMIDLKSKAKKDIDEAGLAKIMVKKSLKEGWVKKK